MKIWIVFDYSHHESKIVKVFLSEASAELCCTALNAEAETRNVIHHTGPGPEHGWMEKYDNFDVESYEIEDSLVAVS